MSQVLDQILMEDIAKYCPQPFVQYHQCISQNHENPMNCLEKQQQLAECIKKDVPAFQKIMTKCGQIMQDYQECLQKNVDKQAECLPLLSNIRECASGCVELDRNTLNKL